MKNKLFNISLPQVLLLFCTLLWVNNTLAIVIYDESIDGEIDVLGNINVNLVNGENKINGSIDQTPPPDTDRIKFTQVAGLTIDSIILSFAGTFDDLNLGQSMNTALFNNTANLFDDNFGNINNGNSIFASFQDTFGPETGLLSKTTDGAIWDFQLSAGLVYPAQDWTLTINTTSSIVQPPVGVAEPTTLLVLLLGLITLMVGRFKTGSNH